MLTLSGLNKPQTGFGILRKDMKMAKEYPLVIEEMSIDDKGYFLKTCKGIKFRIIRCQGDCKEND